MEHLEYKIVIDAPVNKVWETMLQKETYEKWVEKSWPNSSYEGQWKQGEQIRFTGPDGSGTLAELVEVKQYEKIFARHIAALGKGGVEDRTSEMAKKWVGTTEAYYFSEQDGKTILRVEMETTPEWVKMFDEGWPTALDELKRLSEHQLATA